MQKTGESYTTAQRALGFGKPTLPWHPLVKTSEHESRRLIDIAVKAEPHLTHFGIGVYKQNGLSEAAFVQKLAVGRTELEAAVLEVAACADWLDLQKAILTYNPRHSSYGYKHRVERWVDSQGGPHLYVANGSFIAAALGLGLAMKRDGPNAYFKLSERTVKATSGR